jgi:acylphosphatase
LRDGRVEALVAGEAAAVRAIVARCREGPATARAEGVEEVEADEDVASGFEVRRTASPFSP